MPLVCECSDDYDRYYRQPADFSVLATKRRKRCISCRVLIDIGSVVLYFERVRVTLSEIEERIYGEDAEIDLAAQYHCESCGDLFYSLADLGFCVDIEENMRDLVREYADVYGGHDGH